MGKAAVAKKVPSEGVNEGGEGTSYTTARRRVFWTEGTTVQRLSRGTWECKKVQGQSPVHTGKAPGETCAMMEGLIGWWVSLDE